MVCVTKPSNWARQDNSIPVMNNPQLRSFIQTASVSSARAVDINQGYNLNTSKN